MKRRSLFSLICTAMLTFSLSASAWTESWETIRQAAQQVRTIEADFVQTRTLKILKRPIVSRGKMSFRRPTDLRWEYSSPLQSVLIAHDGKVKRYIRRDDGYATDSSARLQAMNVVFDEINLWLAGDFTSSKTFRPHLRAGPPVSVELIPIEPAVRSIVSRVVLFPGAKPGTVESIDIHEGGDNVTHIEFSNVHLNATIPDSRFNPLR